MYRLNRIQEPHRRRWTIRRRALTLATGPSRSGGQRKREALAGSQCPVGVLNSDGRTVERRLLNVAASSKAMASMDGNRGVAGSNRRGPPSAETRAKVANARRRDQVVGTIQSSAVGIGALRGWFATRGDGGDGARQTPDGLYVSNSAPVLEADRSNSRGWPWREWSDRCKTMSPASAFAAMRGGLSRPWWRARNGTPRKEARATEIWEKRGMDVGGTQVAVSPERAAAAARVQGATRGKSA